MEALERARAALRRHREGVLEWGEVHDPVKFVTEARTGAIVMPASDDVLSAVNHVLFVPDESEDSLALLLTPMEVEESVATDRWLAHHLDRPAGASRWASFTIESGKQQGWVFDGPGLMVANPLGRDEGALCKAANASPEALAHACQRHAGVVIPRPVCVGVDPLGLHVRASFGVVRIEFDRACESAEQARRTIEKLFSEG